MELRLDDSRQLLADGARALLEREATPERLAAWEASADGLPGGIWRRAVELGWLGLPFGEDVGGGAGGLVALGAVVTELGRAACPGPFLPTVTAALVADRLGTTKRARALVEAVARDGAPAALLWPADARAAISARLDAGPAAAPAPGGPRAAAPVAGGPGVGGPGVGGLAGGGLAPRLVLDGGPVAVDWAHTAETLVCVARVAGAGAGPGATGDGRCAVVAIDPSAAGVTIEPVLAADNERVAWVRLDGVEIGAAGHLVDGGVADPEAVAEALAAVRLVRAAEMVGGAGRVLDMTVAHTSQRRQFGVPLGTFQAVQHGCADLAISIESARLANWEGLALADQGLPCRRAGAVAGWLAGRAYIAAAEAGAQFHGGLGAIRDYPLHFYYRRAQAMAARLGSEAAQLEELASCLVDPVEAGGPTPWVI